MFNSKITFQLLPFSFRLILPFTFFFYACSFNPAIHGKGETYLQGEWQQDSIPEGKQLVAYSLSHFKFDCDSFFITVNTVSNINYGADSCMNKGRWTEYMKGLYSQKNDTLQLKGFFHNADGSFKAINTCYRTGVYEEFFKVDKKTDSLVQLSGNGAELPLNLKLIKRTGCNPKPL